MNDTSRKVIGLLAALTIIGLNIADFVVRGEVSEVLVAALLMLAFGTAGLQLDKLLERRLGVRVELEPRKDDDDD